MPFGNLSTATHTSSSLNRISSTHPYSDLQACSVSVPTVHGSSPSPDSVQTQERAIRRLVTIWHVVDYQAVDTTSLQRSLIRFPPTQPNSESGRFGLHLTKADAPEYLFGLLAFFRVTQCLRRSDRVGREGYRDP